MNCMILILRKGNHLQSFQLQVNTNCMYFESRADISKIQHFGNRPKTVKSALPKQLKPVKAAMNEKLKNRALRKAFNARGQAVFPKIKSDNDIVFVSDIPKDKAMWLLKKACHDVSNFYPEYMEKAVKLSDD